MVSKEATKMAEALLPFYGLADMHAVVGTLIQNQ